MSTVRLTLFIAETALVAREDPSCRLMYTNEGTRPVEVPNLRMNPDWPQVAVEDVNNADTRFFDPQTMWRETGVKALPFDVGEGPLTTLAPGEQASFDFVLSQRIRLPLPGGYRIHAWFRSEEGVVRSNVVTILVSAVEPVRSDLAYSHGGTSALWFESWVAGGATPFLFVSAVRVGARLRQLQCLRVCRLPGVVSPVLSVAPNGQASGDRGVAWLHGGTFHVVDVGLQGVTYALRSVPAPGGGGFIVGPMWKDPETDGSQALLWRQSGDDTSTLCPVRVEPERVRIGQPVVLRLPQPVWIRAFHDSAGGRRALFLVDDGARLTLFALSSQDRVEVSEQPLAVWPWRLLAVNAQMNGEDTIGGVVAGQPLASGAGATTLVCRWSLDRQGRFSINAPEPWPAVDVDALDHLHMAVDGAGEPAALVHSAARGWSCIGLATRQAVEPPLGGVTSGAPTLRFSPDGKVPLVVWHDANRGLLVVPVGVDVPNFLGDDFIQPPLLPQAP